MKETEVVYSIINKGVVNGFPSYTFYARVNGLLGQQTRIHYIQGEFKFTTNHCMFTIDPKPCPNLTELSEEEYFQEQLVWDGFVDIDLVRVLQEFGLRILKEPESNEFKELATPLKPVGNRVFQY